MLVPAFFHVENVVRVLPAIEVEEPEAEYQEELLPGEEHKVADQVEEQFPKANFANSNSQPGEHRFIYPSILHRFKFMQAPVHSNPVSIH